MAYRNGAASARLRADADIAATSHTWEIIEVYFEGYGATHTPIFEGQNRYGGRATHADNYGDSPTLNWVFTDTTDTDKAPVRLQPGAVIPKGYAIDRTVNTNLQNAYILYYDYND